MLLIALVAALAVLSVTANRFMTVGNLLNQGRLMTEVALVALPMTFIIITGGIDLSVGSIMGLTAILLGVFWQNVGLPLPAAMLLAIVAAGCRRLLQRARHHPPARAAADHDARDARALSRARRGDQPGALGARLSRMVLRARPGRRARRPDPALDPARRRHRLLGRAVAHHLRPLALRHRPQRDGRALFGDPRRPHQARHLHALRA